MHAAVAQYCIKTRTKCCTDHAHQSCAIMLKLNDRRSDACDSVTYRWGRITGWVSDDMVAGCVRELILPSDVHEPCSNLLHLYER